MSKEKSKSIWEKLDVPNRTVLFLLPLILISIPFITPIGIKVPVSSYTMEAWEKINALSNGSVVVMEYMAWPEYWDTLGPTLVALNKILWSKGCKVIYYCLEERAVSVPMMKSIMVANPDAFGLEYGKDYVVFGLVAGQEIGMAHFSANIKGTCPVDYYGNPSDTLPLLNEVNSANDVDLIITNIAYCTQTDWTTRQWGQAYGVPIILVTMWGCVPYASPYYPHYIVAIIPDIEGGAEIERLSGFLGLGTSLIDSKSIGGFLVFAFFLAGNVVMIGLKLSKREGRK